MAAIKTMLIGIRTFFGILLGYEQRLDKYTQTFVEYTKFVEENCVFIDDYGRKLPYAKQVDIENKLGRYKLLKSRLVSVLKIAR